MASEQAEIAALEAMVVDQSSAKIVASALRPEHFYYPNTRAIFLVLKEGVDSGVFIDESLLRLKFEQHGSWESIQPTLAEMAAQRIMAVNVERYVRIIEEYYIKRERILKAREYVAALADGDAKEESNAWDALAALRNTTARGSLPTEVWNVEELITFDTRNDPATVLGRNWLKRGGSSLWVGNTGIGKSSLVVQAASTWAFGGSFFGIMDRQHRDLRSCIIQAENDKGDAAEQLQGVVRGMAWDKQLYGSPDKRTTFLPWDKIRKNLMFTREIARTGRDFVDLLRNVALQFSPDIIFVDPLFSFLGCDASDQEAMSRFLRNWLNPVLFDINAAIIITHHTPKPIKDPLAIKALSSGSNANYAAFGSVELPNWARSILSFTDPRGDGIYELRAFKRMGSGLTSSDYREDVAWLKRADRGICWFESDPPISPEEEIRASKFANQLMEIEKHVRESGECGMSLSAIIKEIVATCGLSERQARRQKDVLIADMMNNGALKIKTDNGPGFFFPA
jgi:hypothetical protein